MPHGMVTKQRLKKTSTIGPLPLLSSWLEVLLNDKQGFYNLPRYYPDSIGNSGDIFEPDLTDFQLQYQALSQVKSVRHCFSILQSPVRSARNQLSTQREAAGKSLSSTVEIA